MLNRITPLILTFNEIDNLDRLLHSLSWARDIVVVDSGSTDGTIEALSRHSNIRTFSRNFDSHANQWNYALNETSIQTDWVLAIDADYICDSEVIRELSGLMPSDRTTGFRAHFVYWLDGQPLRSSLYPPVVVLFRKAFGSFIQDGHTQRLEVSGFVADLRARLRHDDRKPMRRWLDSQDRYAELEASHISAAPFARLSVGDKLRKLVFVAPFLVPTYYLIFRGGWRDGRAGLKYAIQRGVAEWILSYKLLQK